MDTHEIIKQFGGKIVAHGFAKKHIAEAISKLPQDIIQYLIETTWFLCSSPDAYGYAFNGNDVANKHFIFLADELFQQSEHQINYTILHELGYVILNHKNSINFKQTKKEINKQVNKKKKQISLLMS